MPPGFDESRYVQQGHADYGDLPPSVGPQGRVRPEGRGGPIDPADYGRHAGPRFDEASGADYAAGAVPRRRGAGSSPRYDDYQAGGRRRQQQYRRDSDDPRFDEPRFDEPRPDGPGYDAPSYREGRDYGVGPVPAYYEDGGYHPHDDGGYHPHDDGGYHPHDDGGYQPTDDRYGQHSHDPGSAQAEYGAAPSHRRHAADPDSRYAEAPTEAVDHYPDDSYPDAHDEHDRDSDRSAGVGFAASPADINPTEVQRELDRPEEAFYRDPQSADPHVAGHSYADRPIADRYDRTGSEGEAREGDQVPVGHAYGGFGPTDAEDSADAAADEPRKHRAPAQRAAGGGHRAGGRRRRSRILAGGAAAIALVGVLVLGWLAFDRFFGGPDLPPDYVGAGSDSVVIRVNPGDTADRIATAMADQDVVASAAAFFNAAVQEPQMNSVQPGYYELTTRIPGTRAVSELVDPSSRVGNVVISEGRQLLDTRDVNTESVRKGIYTLLSEATCAAGIRCLTPDDFRVAGANSDLAMLSVPTWAADRVRAVPEADRQLEGLIAAGSWDIDPSADATTILSQLVTESVETYESTGLLTAGAANGLDPYDTLVAASLVERESLPADFAKVARVVLNRLEIGQYLEFDSTVNYALSDTEVATTDADRARVTPWNTYASPGLPQTPICSPSVAAVQAMEAPEPGDWLYFVTINNQGETLFTNSYGQHLANIQQVEPGFLVSGR